MGAYKHFLKAEDVEKIVTWELEKSEHGSIALMATCNGIQYCIAWIDQTDNKLCVQKSFLNTIGLNVDLK